MQCLKKMTIKDVENKVSGCMSSFLDSRCSLHGATGAQEEAGGLVVSLGEV